MLFGRRNSEREPKSPGLDCDRRAPRLATGGSRDRGRPGRFETAGRIRSGVSLLPSSDLSAFTLGVTGRPLVALTDEVSRSYNAGP